MQHFFSIDATLVTSSDNSYNILGQWLIRLIRAFGSDAGAVFESALVEGKRIVGSPSKSGATNKQRIATNKMYVTLSPACHCEQNVVELAQNAGEYVLVARII